MRISYKLLSLAVVLGAFIAAPAFAQVPSSAEGSRTGGQIAPMPTTNLPSVGGKVEAGGVMTAPKGAEKVKLVLKSVKIEGQTVYDDTQLAALYHDMLGKTVTLADVFGIADRMTAKYRNDGYILTQVVVPPQTIEGGHVKFRVVEGFVENVTIQGSSRKNIGWLQGFAEKIKASRPLNSKTLERYILLINDLAGMNARAVLSPSKTPGASDIAIVVDQKPIDVFFQVDNRGTRFLGPLQMNLGARVNNIFGLYEGLNFQTVFAPDNWDDKPEMQFYSVTWQQPLNHEGTRLSASASLTDTGPQYSLTPFDVDGIARSINLDLTHPFIRSRNLNLYGTLKFNYLNAYRNDNLGVGGAKDNLRVIRAAGTAQFTDRFLGINTVSSEVSKGLDIFGASDINDPFKTRVNGDPQFFKATAEISRIQRLTDKFEAFISAAGQLSANTLLASEEFGVGGAAYGSAYDNSEITGEDGFAARFELRMNNPVRLPVNLLQVYGFYDGGEVHDHDNAIASNRTRSLVSAGGGARVNLNDRFAGTIELAVPLTSAVNTEADNDARLFGSITGKF